MKRLFGTDGIRGVAGSYPLDEATVRRLGAALGQTLRASGGTSPCVLIGRDTRASGPQLEDQIASGLRQGGVLAVSAGVVTTPALAFMTWKGGHAAGAMISASHNPYRDNGIKILGPDGMKIADATEHLLERMILDRDDPAPNPAHENDPELERLVLPEPVAEGLENYRRHLAAAGGGARALAGLSIVLDCAHGSACHIAPAVFESLGAKVRTIGCDPNGANINDGCGSQHLDPLRAEMAAGEADLGVAFDGDADRCLAVDRTGRALDGDFILYVQALHMRRAGKLRGDLVVATVMSNLWLEKALASEGIRLVRTQVGDKYVLERMLRENASLGGEQSGHIIFLDHFPTGDGILTGLLLAATMRAGGADLVALADGIVRYPQVLLNIKVKDKPDLDLHPVIGPEIRRTEGRLDGVGRVLVRYSGTEPLARVMIEGTDEQLVHSAAEELAGLIDREIGLEA